MAGYFYWSGGSHSELSSELEQVLAIPANDLNGIEAALRAMDDPVKRQAALLEWIRRNKGKQPPSFAEPLCGLLEDEIRVICSRRVGSPHLSGPGAAH